MFFEAPTIENIEAQKVAFSDTWSKISYKDTLEELKDIDLNLYELVHSFDKLRGISKASVSYLTMMSVRIWYIRELLKETGSFYLHCDPTMSHYLKIVCDMIFGEKNFINEVIWSYERWTNNVMGFQSTHDTVFFYAKKYKSHTYNRLFESFSAKSKHKGKRFTKKEGKKLKQNYVDEVREKGMRDVWNISIVNSQAKERMGYPTQKPESLLERIILASSNEGDIVADFFCGCGTAIAVAEKLNRKWIGVDISSFATGLIERRLIDKHTKKIKKKYEIFGLPKDIKSAKKLAENIEDGRLKFEEWVVESLIGGLHKPVKTGKGGWDGHLTFEVIKKKKETVLIEVKSGKDLRLKIENFIQEVNRNASMGIFICFEEDLKEAMSASAKEEGYFMKELFGKKYPIIQVITIEKLLEGEHPKIPDSAIEIFKKAEKEIQNGTQNGMYDEEIT